MHALEPPLSNSAKASLYFIGKDSHGHWVVRDEAALHGGLFIDRSEALRFALYESGDQPRAVVMIPDVLELEGPLSKNEPDRLQEGSAVAPRRRAA